MPDLKTPVFCEIQSDRPGGDRLNQHCVNTTGEGLNVTDVHLDVKVHFTPALRSGTAGGFRPQSFPNVTQVLRVLQVLKQNHEHMNHALVDIVGRKLNFCDFADTLIKNVYSLCRLKTVIQVALCFVTCIHCGR